jgi:hypothetical protein
MALSHNTCFEEFDARLQANFMERQWEACCHPSRRCRYVLTENKGANEQLEVKYENYDRILELGIYFCFESSLRFFKIIVSILININMCLEDIKKQR